VMKREGRLGGVEQDEEKGWVVASYTPEGLGQNGADGLHGLEDGPCDMFFVRNPCDV
jgi:hypothetical protein